MSHRKSIGWLCLVIIGWLLAACEPSTKCHQDTAVRMAVIFQGDSLNDHWNTVWYDQWDSLSVQGVGKDSIILDNGKNITTFAAELKPQDSITAFLMTYHGQTDTLFVEHTPKYYFISPACGCVVYHTITDAYSTDKRVDSVTIVNASVELIQETNICVWLSE